MTELTRLLSCGFSRDSLANHLGVTKAQIDNDLSPSKENLPPVERLIAMQENSRKKAASIKGLIPFDAGLVVSGPGGMNYDHALLNTIDSLTQQIARLHAELSRANQEIEFMKSDNEEILERIRQAGAV